MRLGERQGWVAHEVVVFLTDGDPGVCGIGFKAGLGAVVDADERARSLRTTLLHASCESLIPVRLHLR